MYRSVQREGEKYIKVTLSCLVEELLSDHHLFCRVNFLNLITHRHMGGKIESYHSSYYILHIIYSIYQSTLT